MEEQEYYDVIPEFNSAGRLCNYHTGGEGETVRVMAEEWERFNQLAGRRYEIIDGVVTYNAELEPCMPDMPPEPPTIEELAQQYEEMSTYLLEKEYDELTEV